MPISEGPFPSETGGATASSYSIKSPSADILKPFLTAFSVTSVLL